MPTTCVAFGCNEQANKKSDPSITFHQLPKDPSRRKEWLAAIRRDNYTPGKQARLCSKHFRPDDFDRTSLCYRKVTATHSDPQTSRPHRPRGTRDTKPEGRLVLTQIDTEILSRHRFPPV
ncbi:hypothetical protein O3P69_016094 [Scylla paramamosain]|uniref:THAP-type domain-containing protein n=1 Tax=Scylla paramamosain TaxID=85552 RepID=A0AAW0T941_SCYPA